VCGHKCKQRKKISNKPPNLASQGTIKEDKTKPQVSLRKEIMKIEAEIS
jgi:hypothetical protein